MPWDTDKAISSSYYLALCLVLTVAAICLFGKIVPASGHSCAPPPAKAWRSADAGR